MQDVLEYFEKFEKFHLIAHSYGTLLALKLAEKLEAKGKCGQITLIDGAPLFLRTITMEHYKDQTDEAIQNTVIAYSMSFLFSNLEDDVVKDILSLSTWEEKVNKACDISYGVYGKEYLKLMLNALVRRIKHMLVTDKKNFKLCNQFKATLIRPKTAAVSNISEDYDLQPQFKKKVDVVFIEGNHFSVLENPDLADELNKNHALL